MRTTFQQRSAKLKHVNFAMRHFLINKVLASDEAQYILAQTYNVDGGQWMS